MLAGTVKLKHRVILNPGFYYFDEDEKSEESSLLKVFAPVRLIHRFTSAFQLGQLQYLMVLQLAATERKKKARKQMSYWQCPYKSVLRHTMPILHI